MSKEDAADLLRPDILYHASHIAVKRHNLTVHRMVDSIHIGDAVAHPADRTDLTDRNVDSIQISFQNPDDSLLCKEITRIRLFCQIL